MNYTEIKTLGELKAAKYSSTPIKEELMRNLIANLKAGKQVFNTIHGFENSVIPEVERAILAGHNINFLGLRGQAKTKIARLLVNLLDEYIPVISGTDLMEDPLNPISKSSKDLIEKMGDDTPVSWIHRDERYFEKLATPDVTVADLIGDIDPIKAATLKLSLADEQVLHFGMIPRANRSIFVINELPDLQPRIQVALFNILQEGDIQIRGFKLRLPLDIQFVFTANPEDYTNRGSIVTPLKDRIGSQILTHYPDDIEVAQKITAQEAFITEEQKGSVVVPQIARLLIEQISFEARNNEFIDAKSGVSARMSISALENLISAAERRLLINGSEKTTVRLLDFLGIVPAITGKVELVYEGEQEGAAGVAENLIGSAVKSLIANYYPPMHNIKSGDAENPYNELVNWFGQGHSVDMLAEASDSEYQRALKDIKPLTKLHTQFVKNAEEGSEYFMMEMLLWALAEHSKLNKERLVSGFNFTDLFSSYLRGNEED